MALGLNRLLQSPDQASPSRRPRAQRLLAVLGLLAASVLFVNGNLLLARWYKRWDVTSARLYSLSAGTRELLHGLSQPLKVVVLLSRADPLFASVRYLLDAYRAETPWLEARWVDPDRSPAEFLAVQQRYQILAGKSADGRVIGDASIILETGERHWFIGSEEMVRYDAESGQHNPELEQALSEGIANVSARDKPLLCFSIGHQELDLNDAGPHGLSELARRLEKANYTLKGADISQPSSPLQACRVLIIAGPKLSFTGEQAERVLEYLRNQGNLLVAAGPALDTGAELTDLGLSRITQFGGVGFGLDLVLENDPALRLPRGAGESFLAIPVAHAVTQGLTAPEAAPAPQPILVTETQSLKLAPGGPSRALLNTSPRAQSIQRLSAFLGGNREQLQAVSGTPQSLVLAAAAELPRADAARDPARLIVLGSRYFLGARTFRDPAWFGSRILLESSIAWLAARPRLIQLPEREGQKLALSLTEESLAEILRYVVVYMPLSALLLGSFVLLRRRVLERKSRERAQ